MKIFIVKSSSFQSGRMQVVRQVPRAEKAVADAERRLESARRNLSRVNEEQKIILSEMDDKPLPKVNP